MATITKNYKETVQTVSFTGTQTLASLANGEWTDASSAIDNTAGYPFADFEFVCTAVAFAGGTSAIELYIIPQVDGTNYANYNGGGTTTDEQENQQLYVGEFVTSGANEAQRLALRNVELPDGNFRVGLRNRGGADLAATGSTLKYRRWAYESA